jgi:predicted ferric reductase
MIYPIAELRTVAVILALLLLIAHGWALLGGDSAKAWLKRLPRSGFLGVALFTVAALWTFTLIATMDLGEFSGYRRTILIVIPIAYLLCIRYVEEFLAARALGILLLLGAEPLLEAAFLRPETSRLLVVVFAYACATLGLFYVGMPYLVRDHIAWLTRTERRWKVCCLAGIGYAIALLFCVAAFYR